MVEALEENKLLLGQKYCKVMRYGFCSYHGIVGSKSSCTFKHCWSDESNYIRNQQLIQLPSMYHVTCSSIFQISLWLLTGLLNLHSCITSSNDSPDLWTPRRLFICNETLTLRRVTWQSEKSVLVCSTGKVMWATDEITCLGNMPSPNVVGPLSVIRVLDVQGINIKTEACDLQCGMISFATWSRIAGEQEKDARVPFDSKCRYNYKILECALVHLGYTYYRHLWKHEKEDSTFFGSQQGQQTMNFELCSKPFLPESGM